MKFKNPYSLNDNFCLRTPILPYEFYKKLTAKSEITNHQFIKLFKNDLFNEALFLASPELYKEFKRWVEGKLNNENKVQNLKYTLLKYATRISTRCTPFGLFAGCTSGTFDKAINIALSNKDYYRKVTRLDMSFLSVLMSAISKDEKIKSNLKFFSNSSLYKVGNHYRYVTHEYDKDKRIYSLDGFNNTTYLDKVIITAKSGRTIKQLASTLIDADINIEEAENFINELIENQVLVSELQLQLTGESNLSYLTKRIKSINTKYTLVNKLEALHKELQKLDESINTIESYNKLSAQIEQIHPIPNKKNVLQTDTFINATYNTLDYSTKKEVLKTLTLLNRITLPNVNNRLENFKRLFKKRYETKELRLVDILDTEIGIGYDSRKEDNTPFLDDIYLPEHSKKYNRIVWTVVDTILLKKVESAIRKNSSIIELTDSDFKNIDLQWHDLPNTMSSLIEVVYEKGAIKLFMNSIGGSNGAKLLARFAHGNREIKNQVKSIVELEKQFYKNKIVAEIIHLPQARTGNVLKRPTIYDFEIPYLGKSSLPLNNQISIDDIMVSVKNDQIILRSIRLDKEIIPTLTNAHNYRADSLPVYYFLCDLQTENKRTALGFRWNSIFNSFTYLPRVEYKNVIISKARWNIDITSLKHFYSIKNEYLIKEILLWCKEHQIPQYVQLVEGDNTMVFNMKNKTSFMMFLDMVKNKKQCTLEEFLFNEDSIVKQEENYFCNQFVVTFYNAQKLNTLNNAG